MLLRAVPHVDQRWENNPAHFWLVLLTALVCLALALAISEGGRRRRDARLLLIGLAFVVSAGFLGLHALATPGELVTYKNAGFTIATPTGLVLAGAFAAASAVEYPLDTSLAIVRHGRLMLGVILAVLVLWGIDSIAGWPPLHDPVTPAQLNWPLGLFAAVGVVLYAYAATAYLRVYRRRESGLAFAVAFGFALLAEALVVVVVSLPTSWQLSWWEWHALMLVGFASIATAASREWYEERFSAIYLDETLRGHHEVSVLFADLAGFTPFTEAHDLDELHDMLLAYFGRLAPLIRDDFGGDVHEFVGDQIFAVFNKAGDQPDHAVRAAGAALALQRAAAEIAAEHPGLAAVPRRREQRRGDRRRRRRPRPPHPRRLRRHRQPRRAPRGPGAAGRRADRRRDVRPAPARRGRRARPRAPREGQGRAGRRLRAAGSRLMFLSLDYVYVPTEDVDASARRYVDELGAELVWKVRGMGTVVACVRVADDGPAILLSGHLEGPTPILVYRVADYDTTLAALRWAGVGEIHEIEIPQGPCASFHMPDGQRVAVYELVRPDAADMFVGRADD